MPTDGEPAPGTGLFQEGEPSPLKDEWTYGESLNSVFTEYELQRLANLHQKGWTGNNTEVVIADLFDKDDPVNAPEHGNAVLDIARVYARNATFYRQEQVSDPPDGIRDEDKRIQNGSFASPGDGLEDELLMEQNKVSSFGGLQILGAGNPEGAINSPKEATPTLQNNGFPYDFANHPDLGGLLNEKSGLFLVCSVEFENDEWTLASAAAFDGAPPGHSARAGVAKHAFLCAPDNSTEGRGFSGTSFAAPRATGAAAILLQYRPNLTPQHLGFILLKSAQDIGEPGVDDVYGYGLLNIENAINRADELIREFETFEVNVPATASR